MAAANAEDHLIDILDGTDAALPVSSVGDDDSAA